MDIERLIDANFSGVVSVRQNGKTTFQKAYGYADLPNRIPNEVDTKFATASAGKAFVAAGVLKLIEQGRLDFDSAIGALLDFDLKAIDRQITVRQLLTHTSGIPDYFDESVMDEYADLWRDFPNYRIRASADLLPLFIDKPMMYPPSERFQYSNSGYVVLGLIIEKVIGVPFDGYLADAVFKPCGMANTGYYELDRLPAKCANAYIYDEARGEHYTNIYSVDAKGTGAGGAFTTVVDVERFWDGLLGGAIISDSLVREMLTSQVDSREYGYGMWLSERGGALIPYFQGADPGVSFISSCDPQTRTTITLVSNFGSDVWTLHDKIGAQIGR